MYSTHLTRLDELDETRQFTDLVVDPDEDLPFAVDYAKYSGRFCTVRGKLMEVQYLSLVLHFTGRPSLTLGDIRLLDQIRARPRIGSIGFPSICKVQAVWYIQTCGQSSRHEGSLYLLSGRRIRITRSEGQNQGSRIKDQALDSCEDTPWTVYTTA
jgi:hypothetical protein